MSEFTDDFCEGRRDSPLESFASLEAIVRAAGNYVQPTDDLRPRTLEAARSVSSRRRWNTHLGALAAAVILLAFCGLPSRTPPSQLGQVAKTSQLIRGYDLHRQASLREVQAGFDASWAFYEAFAELRRKQADLFGAAM